MHKEVIFEERDYLPRYSPLPHFYYSSAVPSQLFIVPFLNEMGQGLPQRKSSASCVSGTSLQSPALATCNQALRVAATGRLT